MTVAAIVINLERRIDRRSAMQAQLASIGLEADFVTAVDGSTLSDETTCAATQLSRGEIACYRSHALAWRRVLERGEAMSLVLEDDVEIGSSLIETCEQIERLQLDVDLIRVGGVMRPPGFIVADLSSGLLLAPTRNCSGAHAYLLTQRGARRLLSQFGEPLHPVDRVFDNAWCNGLRALLVSPPPIAIRKHCGSDIAVLGQRKKRMPRGALPMRWIERIQRISQALRLRRELSNRWRRSAGFY
jgi:GR25 family glycosyltransferase involved in LPS biosynthesis